MKKSHILRMSLMSFVLSIPFSVKADQGLVTLFPLDRYAQKTEVWIKPSDPNYETSLMSFDIQKKKAEQFYEHFMGALSPWNAEYVNQKIHPVSGGIKAQQTAAIQQFGNQGKPENKIGHGVNFHPYSIGWIQKISKNMQVSQFSQLSYQAKNRGIAIDNLHGRLLPTEDVHYYSHKIAGEGYPFDNLQMSSVWVGTPVYILGQSVDRNWLLVLTSDYVVWVKANGVARVSDAFVNQWQSQGKKGLAAITQTQTPLKDESGRYLYPAYVGSVFPAEGNKGAMKLMLPVADANGSAVIKYSRVSADAAAKLPLKATPKHFAKIINTLVARPYGWGNLYFYNDCSAELKSLFTPFGIWLPRQSSDQPQAGRMVDLSTLTKEQRLAYLLDKGHPFMTLVYIGGHVVLYIGKYPSLDSKEGPDMAMTYQNLWGLTPKPAVKKSVVGRSAFFPMLLEYPEDPGLVSMADKRIFQVIYLDSSV